METVTLTIPEAGEITTAAQAALDAATRFVIDSPETYRLADNLRVQAGEKIKQGEALFKEGAAEANKLHKRFVALLKAATDPWANVAWVYRKKQIAWDEDQKAIQRRRQAEEDAKAKAAAEEEQRALAETMRELGLEQQAAEVDAETPIVQAPIVPRETESAIKYRSNWTFLIECQSCGTWFKYSNLNLHEDHILKTAEVPAEFLMPDWKKIRQRVVADKNLTKIPGIRPIEEKV